MDDLILRVNQVYSGPSMLTVDNDYSNQVPRILNKWGRLIRPAGHAEARWPDCTQFPHFFAKQPFGEDPRILRTAPYGFP